MTASIPLTFRAAPFPEGYKADPEQMKNDIVARLYAESSESISFFASGSVAPSSNVGPWLKNGQEWYVWSDSLGEYIPQPIPQASLKFIAQETEPDETIYILWIELDGTGKAIAMKYYSGAAWKDIYEDKFADYDAEIAAIETDLVTNYAPKASPALTGTPTAPTAAPATNTTQIATTAFVTAAIAAIVPPAGFTSAPSKANPSITQSVLIDTTPYKLLFPSEAFDPNSAYDAPNSRYVAPATGYYQVFVELQADNNGGTAAAMEIELHVYVNGVDVHTAGMAIATPPGGRWYPSITALVPASAGQFIEIYMEADDGVGVGSLDVSVASSFSVNRVPQV
jgi:hypothetical protein